MTRTARAAALLTVPSVEAPRDPWLDRGREIAERRASSQWDLGDWWRSSDRPDGVVIGVVADDIGVTPFTIWHCARVSREFPAARRRACSHSHHLEVAGLPGPAADALLDKAVAERWSVARIRQEAREEAHDQAVEAERQAQAAQRKLALGDTATAWHVDSRRINLEIREKSVTLEATAKAIVDAIEDLASHPGLESTHSTRRRAVARKLGSLLMPADTGIDLTPLVRPLLDRIWSQQLPKIPS